MSFLGGIRSLTRSRPLASSKSQILCLGSTPAKAEEGKSRKQINNCELSTLQFTL